MGLELYLEVSSCDYTFEISGTPRYDFEVAEAIEIVEPPTDPYDGPYEVIPSVEDQVLDTRAKWMQDDVTVRPIPYYETTNLSGGYTVIIG